MNDLVESVKEKTTQIADSTTEQIESVMPSNGEIRLQLEEPLEVSRADLQIIRVDAERPVVLQITSYPADQPLANFPSVMVRAVLTPTSEDLSDASPWYGKSLPCSVFVQASSSAPIIATELGQTVSLTLSASGEEPGMISGQLGTAELRDSAGKPHLLTGGTITAKLLPVVRGTL